MATFAILLGAMAASLVVHEAGHLVAGRMVGFRFAFLAVGPLLVRASSDGVVVKWRLSPAHWAPMAGAMPAAAKVTASQVAWYVAGGPLANGLAAAVSLTLIEAPVAPVARAMALMSACIFVATVQPFGTGVGIPSDGGRLWTYFADRPTAEREAGELADHEEMKRFLERL
jgi:Zn-dependent protease